MIQAYINSKSFISEVEGKGFISIGEPKRLLLLQVIIKTFRLGGIGHPYDIDYIITSPNYTAIRSGTLTVISEDYGDTVLTR